MKVKGRRMVQVGEIQLEKESLQALLLVVRGDLMETEKSMLKGMIERCHTMLKSRGNLTPTPATPMPVKLDLAPMLLHLQSLTNLLQTTRNGKNGRKDKECNKINH